MTLHFTISIATAYAAKGEAEGQMMKEKRSASLTSATFLTAARWLALDERNLLNLLTIEASVNLLEHALARLFLAPNSGNIDSVRT